MTDLLTVFGDLVRLEIDLWNAVDTRLRHDHGLPLSRFEPLQVIGRRRTCRVQDIADDLVISVGGTSKLVDRIETAGLCHRLANPDDGRSSLIELTQAGRELLAVASRTAEDELQVRIGATLTVPAARNLIATLKALREANRAALTDATAMPAPTSYPNAPARGSGR